MRDQFNDYMKVNSMRSEVCETLFSAMQLGLSDLKNSELIRSEFLT